VGIRPSDPDTAAEPSPADSRGWSREFSVGNHIRPTRGIHPGSARFFRVRCRGARPASCALMTQLRNVMHIFIP